MSSFGKEGLIYLFVIWIQVAEGCLCSRVFVEVVACIGLLRITVSHSQ